MTSKLEERALEVARRALGAPVPPPDVARLARVAMAAEPEPPWWQLALPVAWRTAIAVNLVAVALLLWSRASAPSTTAPPSTDSAPDDVTADVIDDEASSALARALGLGELTDEGAR